jgi:hypothetical protein
MVSSRALTVGQYLAELPSDRREVISAIRDVINRNLPPGYVETMNWGMICWEIPLSRVPDTYNGHPLSYLALAAQKHNFALYSIGAYAGPELTAWLRKEFGRAGQRLDMGKSCIRFRKPEGLPMSVVERLASYMTVEQLLEHYAQSRHGTTKPTSRPAPRKTARVAPAASRPAARSAKKAAPAKRKPAGRAAKPAARRPAARSKRR